MGEGQDHAQRRAASTATIEAFVLRARRIAMHSLAADSAALIALANGTVKIELDATKDETTLVTSLPSEELLESLAARVRPVILQGDPVHHGRVINALGYLLRDVKMPDVIDGLASLKQAWKAIDTQSDRVVGYRVEKGLLDGSKPPVSASDNTLALAWFYGDVVHADTERRTSASEFSVTERYEAAAHFVARVVVHALNTLGFTVYVRTRGLVRLRDAAFTEAVVVRETEIRQVGKMYFSEVGNEPPGSLHEPFGEGWTPFNRQTMSRMVDPKDED